MLILNLKVYPQSIGSNLKEILNSIAKYQEDRPESKKYIYVSPPMVELGLVQEQYPNINILAQHTDSIEDGSKTGWSPAISLKNKGVEYTLLNHSEHRIIQDGNFNEKIEFIQSQGLKVIACCENTQEAKEILDAKPYAIAYEPPELIGGDRSVSKEKPEIVKEFVKLCGDQTIAYIGAGVGTSEDVKIGLELGAKGFILASAFVKAEDKYKKLDELVSPFLN